MVYTNAEEVDLLLNGRSLGRKKRGEAYVLPVNQKVSNDLHFTTKYRLVWQVPYQPGTLEAVAYTGGKPVAKSVVKSAGAPARITLAPDRAAIRADGDDLSFVSVRVEDKDGNLVRNADNLIRITIEGKGSLAAVDNGNAASVESFQAPQRKAFSGMALVVVRSRRGDPGAIEVKAESDGLTAARTTITTAR
jgi:beta-galactosidase